MIETADHRKSHFKTNDNFNFFNVFILATGFESGDSPKCLTKIANKPIIAYQLEFLERNKINEVTLVINKRYSQQISDYVNNQYEGKIKIEIISDKDKNLSLDLFNVLKPRITSKNFMLISGDSILDFNITEFYDNHALNENLLSFALGREDQKFVNQRFSHLNSEIDINIYGVQTNPKSKDHFKNVIYKSKLYEDLNKNNARDKGEKLKFTKKALKTCKNFDLLYNYDDVHIYLFDKRIYNILEDPKTKEACPIITDFVGYLINNFSSPRLRKLIFEREELIDEKRNSTTEGDGEPIEQPSKKLPRLKIVALVLEKPNYVYRISNLIKLFNSLVEFQKNIEDIPKVYFFTANNQKNMFQMHSEQITKNINNDRPYFEGLDNIESITLESLVAYPVSSLAKKSKIMKSVVGVNFNLGGNSKVTSSIIDDNVKIGSNCVITNCIISENVTVEDKCVLSDCIILANSTIIGKTELSNCNFPEEPQDIY